LTSRTQICP